MQSSLMGFNHMATMFIPVRAKSFVLNVLKHLKAKGPKVNICAVGKSGKNTQESQCIDMHIGPQETHNKNITSLNKTYLGGLTTFLDTGYLFLKGLQVKVVK